MAIKKKAKKKKAKKKTETTANKTKGNFATEKQKEKFLEAYRESGNVSKSAAAAGYNRQYMYTLRKSDPEFAMAWDQAKLELGDDIEGSLVSLAKEKNVTAQIFWLKNNRSETYGEKVKIEHKGTITGDVRALSKEELKAKIKEYKAKVAKKK
jgi:hypothetical protein